MTFISRRSLLEKLSLGAGAALLGPMVKSLVAEAAGQLPARKRVVFVLQGNGMNYDFSFAPPELKPSKSAPSDFVNTTQFTLPNMMAALAPLRSQLLLIDGLANAQGGGTHSAGYTALSCVPHTTGAETGPPGGITIDQFIAQGLAKDNLYRSIDVGISSDVKRTLVTNVLAAGRGLPVPLQCSPRQAFADTFGAALRADGNAQSFFAGRRSLFDYLKDDIRRVQAALGGRERQKLDQYLSSVQTLESRQAKLAEGAAGFAACATPGNPLLLDSTGPEDRLEAHFDLAASALACNLTQVVTIASGSGQGHFGNIVYRRLGMTQTTHQIGHMYASGANLHDAIHNFHAGLIAKLAARLQGIREGDKTVFDNTVIVWMSDNGEQHHASHRRWPLVVVGNAGGFLKTGGRFLRYPLRGSPNARSLADFYCTIAHAAGVPTDKFGAEGREAVKGPLPELAS